MSIEFICPTCQQQLRVPDTAAGKNAKCPKCASILAVPAGREELSPLAPPPQTGFHFAPPLFPNAPPVPKTPPGPTINFLSQPLPSELSFGSANKASSAAAAGGNPFADAGQYPATTQGTMQQTRPVFAGSSNPYGSPQFAYSPSLSPNVRVELTPIVDHSIKMWQENLGVLLATTLLPIVFVLPFVAILFGAVVLGAAIKAPGVIALCWIVSFFGLLASQYYFGAGQMHVCMLVARGQSATVGDMFIGLDKFLPSLGYMLLITPIAFIAALPFGVPLIILLLFYWPSYYLVVDGKSGIMESFSAAQRISEGNKLTAFLVHLVGGGFVLLGEMACGVGVFFAMPLVSVMWCTAYLMMSGQIPVPPRRQPYPRPQQPSSYGAAGYGTPHYGPPGYDPKQGPPPAGYLPAAGK